MTSIDANAQGIRAHTPGSYAAAAFANFRRVVRAAAPPTGNAPPAGDHLVALANSAEDMRERLTATLAQMDPEEVRLLSRYLYDGETANEIATSDGRPRRTTAHRIALGIRKLTEAGISVATPGRGRRPEAPITYVSPDALNRIVTRERSSDGRDSGRWIDASKVDRSAS